ncbi:hypothetical protein [Yinghuangia sp. YIM S09857]|uniref:hypothetical protein n=1 Tax=Yinghuangia sp. YIM S09857 TaxID=3436929 RepID=UPI003F53DA5C
MEAELYGLLGGLAGALVTGFVAYAGPLRVQRRAAETARRDLAAQREWGREDELARERRARDEERRREARAAREADRLVALERRDAAAGRLAALRTAPRRWEAVLRRTVRTLASGGAVDRERFEAEIDDARRETFAAFDAVMADGIWLRQSSTSPPLGRSGQELATCDADVTGHLENATRRLASRLGGPPEQRRALSAAVERDLCNATAARHELALFVVDRLAAMFNGSPRREGDRTRQD